MAESEEELKSLLMKVKEESEKVGLKLHIQKMKIMASGPITSWEIDGETVSDFILGGSKITADGNCSHEIKRCLLLGRKVMTNLASIFKNRDITLPTKVHLVKAMVFLVVMYGCESWTVKKAECQRIDAFELWCWRRLLKSPLEQYMNHELPDVQAGFRKGRRTRDQIANIHWIIEKAREFQKNIYFCFIDYAKDFDCVDHNKLENSERDGNTRPPDLPPEKSVCKSRFNN